MRNLNHEAADQHELAAAAHRFAAEHEETGGPQAANWRAQCARDHSDRAYELAQEAQQESEQTESL